MARAAPPEATGKGRVLGLPYLYFSARLWSMCLCAVSLGAWAVTGFNLVEGGVPVIGIQWSTFATFSFFFWLLMANFQSGVSSLSDVGREAKKDALSLFATLRHPLKARESYQSGGRFPSLAAFAVSLLVCMAATFLFESIWVPLYDYFQFGSVVWPVYYAIVSPPVIIRNVGLFILPLALAMTILSFKQWYSVKYRLRGWPISIMFASLLWVNWILMPHSIVSPTSLPASGVIGPQAAGFSLASCYVWPSQGLFPQNTYTFYPCSLLGKSYTPPQILGFFNPDDGVHAVNVLTKFFTFAAVCFPFMVKVGPKK